MGLLEAVTILHEAEFQPRRTIHILLGHDEERGGVEGAALVAAWMRSQGWKLDAVFDEGGCVLTDFPAVPSPVALVGVAEKGYLTLDLTVEVEGGHASAPAQETAIDVLAAALRKIRTRPFPRRSTSGADMMLDYLGPEMTWPGRIASANRWLLRPLLLQRLGATASGDALLRTTIAPTRLAAGNADNVLPSEARATLNLRLLPGDFAAQAEQRIRATIDDDRVQVEARGAKEASPRLSSCESPAFQAVQKTLAQIHPDAVTSPFVLIAGTDSSHFEPIARDIYRIYPVRLSTADLSRIHGKNERISRENYLNLIRYFAQLLRNLNAADGG